MTKMTAKEFRSELRSIPDNDYKARHSLRTKFAEQNSHVKVGDIVQTTNDQFLKVERKSLCESFLYAFPMFELHCLKLKKNLEPYVSGKRVSIPESRVKRIIK